MFTITTYLHPHRDATGILEVAGMHLIEHCLLNNKVIQFPGKLMAPQLEHSTLNVPTLEVF